MEERLLGDGLPRQKRLLPVMDQNLTCQVLDRLSFEWDELCEDIEGLSLDLPVRRIGDFGCGRGFISWCLKLAIPNAAVIGIDKFDLLAPPESDIFSELGTFSIENVESLSLALAECGSTDIVDPDYHDLIINLRELFHKEKQPPIFRKGNFITGEGVFPDLISYFDLAYCKRVCSFIYGKDPWSDAGIDRVLHNIARALKPGGQLCLVEISEITLESSLKRAGFRFIRPRHVFRPYKTPEGVIPSHPYKIYHCRKN